LKADGIAVVLVQMPVYAPERILRLGSSQMVRRVADEAGVPFLDYLANPTSPFTRDFRQYADWVHLNRTGASLFSDAVREDLEQLLDAGELPTCADPSPKNGPSSA